MKFVTKFSAAATRAAEAAWAAAEASAWAWAEASRQADKLLELLREA